jgi:hypothetical protein
MFRGGVLRAARIRAARGTLRREDVCCLVHSLNEMCSSIPTADAQSAYSRDDAFGEMDGAFAVLAERQSSRVDLSHSGGRPG